MRLKIGAMSNNLGFSRARITGFETLEDISMLILPIEHDDPKQDFGR